MSDEWSEPQYEGDPDDDGWQAYKDGVATSLLHEDGSQREPDEPDWDRAWNEALAKHERDAHDGNPCSCPPAPSPADDPSYSDGAPF